MDKLPVLPLPECAHEMFRLICGRQIGEGAHRKVYQHNHVGNWVVKIEEEGCFSNAIEWDTWMRAGQELKRWLAPVIDISPGGRILIMLKAEPIREAELPKRIPALFNDLKISNWGLIGNCPVCIDYGWLSRSAKPLIKAAWG